MFYSWTRSRKKRKWKGTWKMLKELLKKYLADDAKVNEFLAEMKANKVFTASEENLDKRYGKLKDDYTAKETELQTALNQITQLQQASQDGVNLQAELAQRDQAIATLQAQNAEIVKERNIEKFLLSNHAKAEDLDYLLFKLKDEIKLDDKGNVTNGDDLMKLASTKYQNQFEASVKKEVEVIDLPGDDGNKDTITKAQFKKMNYQQRAELFDSNQELYEQLTKGE